MRLTTDRLLLREYQEDDLPAMREIDSDLEVQRYRGTGGIREQQTRDYIRWAMALEHDPLRTRYPFAVVQQAEDRFIGGCGLNLTNVELREAEIWYALHRRSWGQGFATEAAGALVAFGFRELGLHRIWAKCIAENAASSRVLEKAGMQREGCFREQQWFDGRWWDVLLYAILEREWREMAAG